MFRPLDTHASITDPETRRQSRLLGISLGVLAGIFACVDVVLTARTPGYSPPWAGYAILFSTIAINRAGFYRSAAVMAMSMFSLVAFGLVYSGQARLPMITLGYVALGPMLGAIFLPIWGVMTLTFANMIGLALAPVFVPAEIHDGTVLIGHLSVNAMVGVLASLYMHHRNAIEADRRAVLLAEIAQREKLEEQLRQAQKLEAMGRLSGGVAHDFNNLLMVILGNVELLRHKSGNPELDEIAAAASSASALTNQLLAFGRRAMLAPKVLDLGVLVRDSVGLIRRLIGAQIEIEYELPRELHAARLDRTQIEQVLLNLAANARDAMPNGGALRLGVSSVMLDENVPREPDARPGPYVCLSVADTGEGMDDATRQRIFEPFFTTKERGHGTGLGLASVFGIVSQSGGFIRVHSQLQKGTRFELFFPHSTEQLGGEVKLESASPAPGRGNVLLLEDNDGVRTVVTLILKEGGYRVLTARSLAEAREVWSRHHDEIALLLTDMVLPDGNGSELALSLIEERRDLPVLCMSGYAEATTRAGDSVIGLAHIQKPFASDELLQRVRQLIETPAHSGSLSA
jgi:signal transduction histidine kinase/ActR/RegA family two-component response regulator